MMVCFFRLLSAVCASAKTPYLLALKTSTEQCCDRHPGSPKDVDPSQFFEGPFLFLDTTTGIEYYGNNPNTRIPVHPEKTTGTKRKTVADYRATRDRPALTLELVAWVRRVSQARGPFHISEFILSNTNIIKLARARPGSVVTEDQITTLLGEDSTWKEKWASQILGVVADYDKRLTDLCCTTKPSGSTSTCPTRASAKGKENMYPKPTKHSQSQAPEDYQAQLAATQAQLQGLQQIAASASRLEP